jgi:hypothetical protein
MADIAGNTVVGVFESLRHAEAAVRELRANDFGHEGIGLVSRQRAEDVAPPSPEELEMLAAEENVVKGVSAGAVTGAGLGSLWALGIATGVLPVVGPFVAAGILTALAAGAAGGALAGGLIGALVGLGIPEPDAARYEEAFQSGRAIVTVRTDSRQTEAAEILNRHGTVNVGPPLPGTPTKDLLGRTPHVNLSPEHLHERDTASSPGGFTTTGGFGSTAQDHDSTSHFHLPGEDPDQEPE